MELSKEIIYFRLSAKYRARYLNDTGTTVQFGRPVFYMEKHDLSRCVVLISPEELEKLSRSEPGSECLYICCSQSTSTLTIMRSSVIGIDESISPMEVFNLLQDIYNSLDCWDNKLRTICYEGGTYGDLIDCCDTIICDPICLSDNMFRYIAFSKVLSAQRGLCTYTDIGKRISLDKVTKMVTNPRFAVFDKVRGVKRIPPFGKTEGELLLINIFQKDDYAGRLMIKLAGDADEARIGYDKAILEHLYGYVLRLFNKYLSFNQNEIYMNSLREFLQSGLENKRSDVTLWEKVLEEYGWSNTDTFQLVQIKPNSRYGKKMYAAYFSTVIQNRWRGCACIDYQGGVVLFVNLKQLGTLDKSAFERSLSFFLSENLLIAGTSRVFSDIASLYPAYMQAGIALDFGTLKDPTSWYYSFDTYVLDYMLANCTGRLEATQISSEKLMTLQQYDTRNNTEYCRTLYTYLRCKFNSTAAAKQLMIQRSSFNYRMERIQELVRIDFSSSDEILYLELSFKLLNMIGS